MQFFSSETLHRGLQSCMSCDLFNEPTDFRGWLGGLWVGEVDRKEEEKVWKEEEVSSFGRYYI